MKLRKMLIPDRQIFFLEDTDIPLRVVRQKIYWNPEKMFHVKHRVFLVKK
ncbi:hypothetical protein HMPREF1862_00661 [Varibaculum cambriense]|uniref:UbiC transcription regulator-associated domain-containing protein n=1 Tax=Varibaculum cambriense TaxID=184870 RepID=A0AB34X1S2_9ACTO|nr:hypothetical protein HMPREF1862_00661 [Varibaculum cambriense]